MSELGVPDSVFFELQEKWFVDKSQAQRSEVYIYLIIYILHSMQVLLIKCRSNFYLQSSFQEQIAVTNE